MQIWSTVFAGQTSRLVRVAAFQNAQPDYGDMMLKFNNTYQSVDAFATAPYLAFHGTDYTGQTLDQIMNTVLPANMTCDAGLAQPRTSRSRRNITFVT